MHHVRLGVSLVHHTSGGTGSEPGTAVLGTFTFLNTTTKPFDQLTLADVQNYTQPINFGISSYELNQWMLRITKYADRLLSGLEKLDWPEKVKTMQTNWIGKSEGAEVTFTASAANGTQHPLKIFTTRPDTLFGATYMVMAPEHPLVKEITSSQQAAAVEAYRCFHGRPCDQSRKQRKDSDLDRGLRSDGLRHRRHHGSPGS